MKKQPGLSNYRGAGCFRAGYFDCFRLLRRIQLLPVIADALQQIGRVCQCVFQNAPHLPQPRFGAVKLRQDVGIIADRVEIGGVHSLDFAAVLA